MLIRLGFPVGAKSLGRSTANMKAQAKQRAIGCDDGEFLIERCPCDHAVSTPESLWGEDSYAESLAYTLGRRITPIYTRRHTQRSSIAPARRAALATIPSGRHWRILQEREGKRTLATIGHEHGITRERVRQIVLRARREARPTSSNARASSGVVDSSNPQPTATSARRSRASLTTD